MDASRNAPTGFRWTVIDTHLCERCDGLGRVSWRPSADCPDYEVVCGACEGRGYVEDEHEELVEYQPEEGTE
jgi:DnaJ-class molecular chaperone